MTSAESAKLRALCEAATPGPWRYDGEIRQLTDGGQGYPLDFYPDSKDVVCDGDDGTGGVLRNENGEYIAAVSPAVVTALLDENARLREALLEACIKGSYFASVARDGVAVVRFAELAGLAGEP